MPEVKVFKHRGGTVEFVSNLDELDDIMRIAIGFGLDAIGQDAASTAAKKAPYDTGALRNSIGNATDREELIEYIGTNIPYAKYQEFGTSRIKGKHFLRFGATAHMDEYAEIMKRYIEDYLR